MAETADTFLKQDLTGRGWTPGLIERFLGRPDDTPHRSGGGYFCVYDKSRVLAAEATQEWQEALKRIRNRRKIPPKSIDLLAAIRAASRAAKRYRNSGQVYYRKRLHGFAGDARFRKEELYDLKDKGIAQAYRDKRIAPVAINGGWVEYCGEDYCFHSSLLPAGVVLGTLQKQPLHVEAKPSGAAEPKLKDARFTLESLPPLPHEFTRVEVPEKKPKDGGIQSDNLHFNEDDENDLSGNS